MALEDVLANAGIHMKPVVFIAIIAGGVVFILALIVTVVVLHRRSKRRRASGEFEKPPSTLVRSGGTTYDPFRSYAGADLESQRNARQPEQPYKRMHERERAPRRGQTVSPPPPMAYPAPMPMSMPMQMPPSPTASGYPAPDPVLMPPPPLTNNALQLTRGASMRSVESSGSVSEYSVASAARETLEYHSFTATLPTVPASPLSPKWPSSPGPYQWPKRKRASQIRDELAPETYNKVKWKAPDDAEMAQVPQTPLASAMPSTAPMSGLRISVPRATSPTSPDFQAGTSVGTVHLAYLSDLSPAPPPTPARRF